MSLERKLDKNGVAYLWSKIKATFALKTDVPSASTSVPGMDSVSGQVGSSTTYARGDHTHPKDTSKADLTSPNFSGTPTAPTAQAGTNNTQLATTAFVKNSIDNINMSAYQHKLTPGRNIEITENNVINGVDLAPLQALIATKGNAKVLSKTWAEYSALSNDEKLDVNTIYAISDKNFIMYKNVPYGKTIANPNGEATIQLTKLQIADTIYSIPEGGGGLQYWIETSDQFYRQYDIPGMSAYDGYIFTETEWYNEGKSQAHYGHFLFRKANDKPAIMVVNGLRNSRYFYLVSTDADAVEWEYKEINYHTEWQTPSENGVNDGRERNVQKGTFTYDGATWYISQGYFNHSSADIQTYECPVLESWSVNDSLSEVGLKIMSESGASPTTTYKAGIGKDNDILYALEGEDKILSVTDEGVFNGSDFKANGTSLLDMINAKQDKLIEGSNITIGADGKTISATDTDEISELKDVVLSSLTSGQVLKYDSASQKWINANESGGSEVIANPSGTATDTLNKISIDGTIYGIEGGGGSGGGSGYSETTLWEDANGVSFTNQNEYTMTLNNSMMDYDMLMLEFAPSSDPTWHYHVFVPVSQIDTTGTNGFASTIIGGNAGATPRVEYVSDTSLFFTNWARATPEIIYKVIGIKFGGGGSEITYSTTEQKIGKWIDGSDLYQITVATGGNVPSGATLIERTTQTGYDTLKYTKTSS